MLARSLIVSSILVTAIVPTSAQTGFSDHCPDGKALPFAALEVKHPIDATCGIKGKPSSPAASQTQNQVKNDFCKAANAPESFTPQMFIDLEHKTKIKSGTGKEPADRTALQNLGEGKIVRMKANLIEAHHADVGTGESVNCGGLTEEDNDIHIAFGPSANSKECSSVSGEISPHFRPASWSAIGDFEKFNPATKLNVVDPVLASRLQAHPYRITGQLFFDASHTLCACGTKCNPSRGSRWEIHPIYNIEVCKAGAACNADNDSDWISFDSWWNTLAPPQKPKPPHSHEPDERKKKGSSRPKKQP
jgi:hypothetical protein